ncbi:MAG: hypothetical protein Q9M11_01310 [Mariprofundaceae bacterium]|nr:hypothetical protein [Mariprofundaceae bacterium]
MSIKIILGTIFAMFLMINISIAKQTVCHCVATTPLEVAKENADNHARYVAHNKNSTALEKQIAATQKKTADDAEKIERDALIATNGACACATGTIWYNVPAGSSAPRASTSAFREIRGQ